MGRKPDILLLATADWDHPLWTNKQHVACSLAARGHRVLYVESLGLRAIQPTGRDWSRFGSVCLRVFQSPRPVRPGIWFVLPWFSLVSRKAVVSIESLAVECNLGLDAASAGFAKAMVVDL